MTEKSMKELIARAICKSYHPNTDPDWVCPDRGWDGELWQTYRLEAEVALETLLNPSFLMINAVTENGCAAGAEQIRSDFQAAIQAAIDEPIMEGAH